MVSPTPPPSTQTPRATTPDTDLTPWQLFIFFLSVYALVALAAETVLALSPESTAILLYSDTLVCLVFLADFFGNLVRAKSKLAYLKWGWLDLASSLPTVQVLRWGRLVRVIRVLRVFRALRSTKTILGYLFADRSKGTLTATVAASFVLVVFASLAILNLEVGEDANIRTAEEALWWSLSTLTTVGYGDVYPVSTAGRLLAAALMTAGVGLFGSFTAYLASFVLKATDEAEQKGTLQSELEALRGEVAALRQSLEERRE